MKDISAQVSLKGKDSSCWHWFPPVVSIAFSLNAYFLNTINDSIKYSIVWKEKAHLKSLTDEVVDMHKTKRDCKKKKVYAIYLYLSRNSSLSSLRSFLNPTDTVCMVIIMSIEWLHLGDVTDRLTAWRRWIGHSLFWPCIQQMFYPSVPLWEC